MIYELRVYEAAEGKAGEMRQRFYDHVVPRLGQHGIELLGVFVAPGEDGRLTYLSRFVDEAARFRGWASFGSDAAWKSIKASSETDGPLLERQTITVLQSALPGLPLC